MSGPKKQMETVFTIYLKLKASFKTIYEINPYSLKVAIFFETFLDDYTSP
jgi:hypothetical protein